MVELPVRDSMADNVNKLLVVFENQDRATVVDNFCRENVVPCRVLNSPAYIRREKEPPCWSPGEIRYNVVIDNTESVPFVVDDQEKKVIVTPTSDVQELAQETCCKWVQMVTVRG